MVYNNPQHIGIILDGNRRFAKRLSLEPWKGHEFESKTFNRILEYVKELKIKELTVYCLSTENLKRPKKEVDFLFKIFREEFLELEKEENKKKIKKDKVKLRFIGNLDLLPKDIKERCIRLEDQTKNNSDYTINFAIAYGGRQEIIEAVKKIIKNRISEDKMNEKVLESYLYLKDSPDMIIRTGGDTCTSNFLPWQSVYTEWFFIDKLWPEFDKKDLVYCIEEFKRRKRRFGK